MGGDWRVPLGIKEFFTHHSWFSRPGIQLPNTQIMFSLGGWGGYYSGTSHNGLSEIQTASIQWTNYMPPIDYAIEIIHFQSLRDGQPPVLYQSCVARLYSKSLGNCHRALCSGIQWALTSRCYVHTCTTWVTRCNSIQKYIHCHPLIAHQEYGGHQKQIALWVCAYVSVCVSV